MADHSRWQISRATTSLQLHSPLHGCMTCVSKKLMADCKSLLMDRLKQKALTIAEDVSPTVILSCQFWKETRQCLSECEDGVHAWWRTPLRVCRVVWSLNCFTVCARLSSHAIDLPSRIIASCLLLPCSTKLPALPCSVKRERERVSINTFGAIIL